jgi:phosphoglycolate phosphatase-like HAD superfamily hydrolase
VTVFLVERCFAEQLNVTPDGASSINQVNADVGVQWLISFLSADKKKTYCLYEAPNPEAIREAARRNGVPADRIIEVGELTPDGLVGAINRARFQATQGP